MTILCLSKNGWEDDKLGYTWVRNGKLLKVDAPSLYYEDLYRGGSVLYMTDLQVNTIQCHIMNNPDNKIEEMELFPLVMLSNVVLHEFFVVCV